MTYETAVVIVLTALCALLAALAIIIGGAAVWGYQGIKKSLTQSVTDSADEALQKKLSEYPDSKAMFELFHVMQAFHDRQVLLSSQLITPSASKTVARTTRKAQDKHTGSIAKDYPGKGK